MKAQRKLGPLTRTFGQVMHGCRQFVVWIVPLSGVTNATLIVCYICQTRLPALGGRKRGWRQVSMSLWHPGLHAWYNRRYNRSRRGNPELILKGGASSDWGLQLDLMKPELLVIAGQLYCGEYVLESCTRVAMRSSTLVGENPTKTIHRVLKRNTSLFPWGGRWRGKPLLLEALTLNIG